MRQPEGSRTAHQGLRRTRPCKTVHRTGWAPAQATARWLTVHNLRHALAPAGGKGRHAQTSTGSTIMQHRHIEAATQLRPMLCAAWALLDSAHMANDTVVSLMRSG